MSTPHRQTLQQAGEDVALLATRAQQGCRVSFGRLVERYWPTAVALAMARIHDPVQAEDIAQQSFLVAYSRMSQLREPGRFPGWLASIISTQSLTHQRQARIRRALPLDDQALDNADGAEPQPMDEEQRAAVLQAVGQLAAKYQEVILLRFVTGLSAVEIAVQLEEQPRTIRVWLCRAYAKLRPVLAKLASEVQS